LKPLFYKLRKDLSNLSQEELKKLTAYALRQIKAPEKGLGSDLFETIIATVPQVAIEAIIVNNIEKPRKILVTWREDSHYYGWHFPGGFIRFGQSFDEATRSIIKRELGVNVSELKDTGVKYSQVDGRGHTIGIVFLVKLENKSTQGQWFNCVPKKLLNHHKKLLERTLGWK